MNAKAPGPRGHPLWGNSPDYTRDPLGFHVDCARDFGDVVSLRLGLLPVVVLNHPDHVEEMLVNQARSLGKGLAFDQMRPLIGNGILSSEGSFWLHQRRLIQPAFHRERLDSYAATMVTDTDRMLASWRDGDVLDVREEMARLTLQIAGHTLFGADVSLEAAHVGAALTVILEHFEARLDSISYLIPYWVPTPGNIRLKRAMRILDSLGYGMIRERRQTRTRRDDVLSLLLEVRDEDGNPMPDRQVRDEAMTLLMAGHETTALATSRSRGGAGR